jgi:hypothetical protein
MIITVTIITLPETVTFLGEEKIGHVLIVIDQDT